ncbi:unnamed protein product [Hermetia illucens]|uniref:Uncharacterized protein n=1 Tax=Hermetia illucens TaxID=343691 RepID=A0A7R8V5N6_HERIL|nr:unnamed protein product [Hermetia illucens]
MTLFASILIKEAITNLEDSLVFLDTTHEVLKQSKLLKNLTAISMTKNYLSLYKITKGTAMGNSLGMNTVCGRYTCGDSPTEHKPATPQY